MTTAAVQIEPGTVVGERYRIEEQLGQGGYGAVFRATQLNLDRPVALKILLATARGDENQERFRREAEILQQLEHPNIVRLIDFGVGPGESPYLVFELLHGRTLDQVIRAHGPLPPARVARVGAQILKALMEAHARGFIHRDIKPANVFLSDFQGEPDFVKVLDFGIAKGGGARALTGEGTVVGTLPYLAPEQLGAGGDVGSATDLFALGLTLAEALSGETTFRGYTLPELAKLHQAPEPVALPALVVDGPLGPVIQRATRKRPEQRHASAGEMLAHLEAAIGQPVPPTRQPLPPTAAAQIGLPPTGPAADLPPTGPAALVGGASHDPRTAAPDPSATPLPHAASSPADVAELFRAAGSAGHLPVPLPRRAPAPSKRRWPWVAAAVALLAAAAGAAAWQLRPAVAPPRKPPPPPAEPAVEWFTFDREGDLAEAQINGDGIPDIVGLCGAGGGDGSMSVCAIDGATWRPLWRWPAGAAASRAYSRLGASSRGVAFVDAAGIAHLLDLGTGAERHRPTRFGARPESICADASGKLWVVTTNQRAWSLDPAAAARPVAAGSLPSGCTGVGSKRYSIACVTGRNRCGADFEAPTVTDVHLRELLVDGTLGIGVGAKTNDASVPMLVGFTPGRTASTLRWRRPVAPGDGLTAAGSPSEVDLRGGRAVVLYHDTSRALHLAALDAASGRGLWDVASPKINSFVLSPTRLYLSRGSRLDVRDAQTGKLLGGVGKGD